MISYKNLKVLLAKKEISGVEFRKLVDISQSTYTKINQNQFISMEVIDRICDVLDCDVCDIVEHIKNNEEKGCSL